MVRIALNLVSHMSQLGSKEIVRASELVFSVQQSVRTVRINTQRAAQANHIGTARLKT